MGKKVQSLLGTGKTLLNASLVAGLHGLHEPESRWAQLRARFPQVAGEVLVTRPWVVHKVRIRWVALDVRKVRGSNSGQG